MFENLRCHKELTNLRVLSKSHDLHLSELLSPVPFSTPDRVPDLRTEHTQIQNFARNLSRKGYCRYSIAYLTMRTKAAPGRNKKDVGRKAFLGSFYRQI